MSELNRAELNGKGALVTGSTSGIGWAIARALAQAGADVLLNGFGDPGEIEARRAGLQQETGVRVHYDGADMSNGDDIARLMDEAAGAFGPIDIVVNNAGIQHVAPIEAFPAEQWDRIIAINLSSAFHTIRAALPIMRERGWGRIVNVASTHGLVASKNKSAYVAAKHGIVGLTKTVALEAAEDGITANAICPGFVRTELVDRQIAAMAAERGRETDEVAHEFVSEKHPNGRFVKPEEVGALAVFLCSDAAASITGAVMPMDGGWIAQ